MGVSYLASSAPATLVDSIKASVKSLQLAP
jgi:hypothetical protein